MVQPTSVPPKEPHASAAESAELHRLERRLRCRRGPEPGATVRAREPGGADGLGPRHGELSEPHRPRGEPRPRRLLHPRLQPRHRRRDHGPEQVRSAAWPVAGPRVAGLVGGRAPLPHAGVRHDPPPAPVVLAVGHDVPLHRREAGRGPRAGAGGRAGQGRPARRWSDGRREFLDADLVDTLHVAVAPVELGAGTRLWESPDELLDRFHCDVVPSPNGVTHHLFWRK